MEESISDCNPTLPGHPDPYSIYRRLRETSPVFWNRQVGGWVFTRYADAQEVLHHEELVRAGYVDQLAARFGDGLLLQSYRHDLGFLDPPDHTRLRSLIGKAFTPVAVEAVRPHIRRITNELLDRVATQGRMDVIADLGYPLPVRVISEMLGIPAEQREAFKNAVFAVVRARGLAHDPAILEQANRGYNELVARLNELLIERRARPVHDLLSALVAARDGAHRLTDAELVTTVVVLFGAGHETTKNLIGNAALALLRHPEELERLRRSPELIANAIEEVLRYDSPTQAPPPRIARTNLTIGGQPIRKGESVSVLLGAANRDPAEFDEPDRFDITRHPNRHVAFSLGIHYCLGAGLARAEAQIAIEALIERMPNLALTGQPIEWQVADRFRGPVALPVDFQVRRAG